MDDIQRYRERMIEQVQAIVDDGLVESTHTVAALMFILRHNVSLPCDCRNPDGEVFNVNDPGLEETGRFAVPWNLYWTPVID